MINRFAKKSIALLIIALLSTSDVTASEKEWVILIHGIGMNNMMMWKMAEHIETQGFHVKRIGYPSWQTQTQDILNIVNHQINTCCADLTQKIHFVGYSLGGLLVRNYLNQYRPAQLGNTVLIGTPNQGTEIADRLMESKLIKYLMPITSDLGTSQTSLPNQLPPPNYPVGIIAGLFENDLNEPFLPGLDDGIVPISSTQLKNMQDFILIHTGHPMMFYNQTVSDQVIHFLKNGVFRHPDA